MNKYIAAFFLIIPSFLLLHINFIFEASKGINNLQNKTRLKTHPYNSKVLNFFIYYPVCISEIFLKLNSTHLALKYLLIKFFKITINNSFSEDYVRNNDGTLSIKKLFNYTFILSKKILGIYCVDKFLFDRQFYMITYQECKDIDPWLHYSKFGYNHGYFPTYTKMLKKFNGNAYEYAYPDVKESTLSAFDHYNTIGRHEGRICYSDDKISQRYIHIENKFFDTNVNGTIAIHLHIYHKAALDEIISYICNIPYSFDLYVSVNNKDDIYSVSNKLHDLKNVQNIFIEAVPNRGGDIAPMLCTYGKQLQNYDYICHIYTNQYSGLNDQIGDFFHHEYLLKSLLGSAQQIKNIFHYLIDVNAGIVFPERFYAVPQCDISPNWFHEFPSLRRWFDHFGLEWPHNQALFPLGSMFWCKSICLKRLWDGEITYSAFPQDDDASRGGNLALAIERFLGYAPLQDGYDNYVIMNPLAKFFGKFSTSAAQRAFSLSIFESAYYTATYADAAKSSLPAKLHFLLFEHEGRRPCRRIPSDALVNLMEKRLVPRMDQGVDCLFYLTMYWDAAQDFLFGDILPQRHYEQIGKTAGFVQNGDVFYNPLVISQAQKAKYSIVIPVYNSEPYLENCLRSAYGQTAPHVDVVIVNDGSPDNAASIIEKYRQLYPERTTVITHERNQGLVRTHRDGIAAVKGDYFAILDGDDWLDPYFCEAMGELAIAGDAPCVCCGWTRPSTYVEPMKKRQEFEDPRILVGHVKDNAIVHWSGYPNIHYGLNRKLYKTETWRHIDPIRLSDDIINFEDSIVTIRFMLECQKVIIVKNKFYHWFNNQSSIGNRMIDVRFISDTFYVINELQDLKKGNQQQRRLFERNIDNIFITEFLRRLNSTLYKIPKQSALNLFKVFAKNLDASRSLFTEKQFNILSSTVMREYFLRCRETKSNSFILFVDPVGIDNIKRFFIEYWKQHFNIPFQYIQCNASAPLSTRLKYIELGCQCRCVVTSGGWGGLSFYTSRPIIQLWHGMGALKKVAPHSKALRPALAFCSSEGTLPVYSHLFGVPKNKILPYGSVVADSYLDMQERQNGRKRALAHLPQCRGKKVYLWCPTFRGLAPDIYLQDHLDFSTISKLLREDEIFLVKYHPAIKNFSLDCPSTVEFFNIFDVTDEDLFDCLCITDVMMTDYSSSLHYAMLIDTPVCFLVTDNKQYSNEQGLLINYDTDLPGPKCEDTLPEHVLAMLRSARSDSQAYKDFKQFHIGGCKGDSRQKIAKAITKFLNEELAS